MDLQSLILEGASLKARIEADTAKLREINKQLEAHADFGEKKTAHMVASNIKATIQRKENVKWDQTRLEQIKGFFPEFSSFFSIQYKPDNKKIGAMLETRTEFADAIRYCREVSPGAPQVKYERIEDA